MTRARDLASSTPGTTGQPFAWHANSGVYNGGSGTVTFPAGRFTQSPICTIATVGNSGNFAETELRTVSSSAFTFGCQKTDFTGFHWLAVQMTPSSGGA